MLFMKNKYNNGHVIGLKFLITWFYVCLIILLTACASVVGCNTRHVQCELISRIPLDGNAMSLSASDEHIAIATSTKIYVYDRQKSSTKVFSQGMSWNCVAIQPRASQEQYPELVATHHSPVGAVISYRIDKPHQLNEIDVIHPFSPSGIYLLNEYAVFAGETGEDSDFTNNIGPTIFRLGPKGRNRQSVLLPGHTSKDCVVSADVTKIEDNMFIMVISYANLMLPVEVWQIKIAKESLTPTKTGDMSIFGPASVAISGDGTKIVCQTADEIALLNDKNSTGTYLVEWKQKCQTTISEFRIRCVDLNGNGTLLAYRQGGCVLVASAINGGTLFSIDGLTNTFQFLSDSNSIAMASHKSVDIWKIPNIR